MDPFNLELNVNILEIFTTTFTHHFNDYDAIMPGFEDY